MKTYQSLYHSKAAVSPITERVVMPRGLLHHPLALEACTLEQIVVLRIVHPCFNWAKEVFYKYRQRVGCGVWLCDVTLLQDHSLPNFLSKTIPACLGLATLHVTLSLGQDCGALAATVRGMSQSTGSEAYLVSCTQHAGLAYRGR